METLKKHIAQKQYSPLYVFYGDEYYLKEFYLNRIKKDIVNPDFEEFNYIVFNGDTVTAQKLSDACESIPAFSDKKLVVIKDLSYSDMGNDFKKDFGKIMASIPEFCTVILFFDSETYSPSKWQQIFSESGAKATQVNMENPQGAALLKWISDHFNKKFKKSIGKEAAEHLAFVCSNSMTMLINEIEKVGSFCKSDVVKISDIDEVVTPTLEARVFELTDELSRRNFKKASQVLEKLIALKEEPIVILGAIAKNYTGMYIAKSCANGPQEVMRVLEYKSLYPAKKIYESSLSFTESGIREIIKLCAECDLKLKSSKLDNFVELNLLLCNIAVMHGGAK